MLATYPPDMPLREALQRYFEVNRFGVNGGYDDAWVDFKLGPIPLPFPNTSARLKAVRFHDLHHILTGYDTDARGEFEISAWEIAAGCRSFVAAWQLNLAGIAGGLFGAPARTFRAFMRGRNTDTFYGLNYEELLGLTVAEARARAGTNGATAPAQFADVAAFVAAALAGLVMGALMLAVIVPLLPIAFVALNLQRRGAKSAASGASF